MERCWSWVCFFNILSNFDTQIFKFSMLVKGKIEQLCWFGYCFKTQSWFVALMHMFLVILSYCGYNQIVNRRDRNHTWNSCGRQCQVLGLVFRNLESNSSSDPKYGTEFLRPSDTSPENGGDDAGWFSQFQMLLKI